MKFGRYKALSILSNLSDSNWKIGKTDSYINTISSMLTTLPSGVFDTFAIDDSGNKKISTVEFALMTYEMAQEQRKALMETYNISTDTMKRIFQVADEIATYAYETSIQKDDEDYER